MIEVHDQIYDLLGAKMKEKLVCSCVGAHLTDSPRNAIMSMFINYELCPIILEQNHNLNQI